MALKTFLIGKVDIGTDDIGHLTQAALKIAGAVGDTTSIGDTWKSELPLGQSWTLTLAADYDPENAAQATLKTAAVGVTSDGRAIASVKMYEDGTHYYSGAAILTDFSITKAANAIDKVSISLSGNGVLVYT